MSRDSRVLVIAGMHRSGTSLLAGLAAGAGIDMGAELVGGSRGNRRGHFEDAEIVRFHESCLERLGAGPLRPPGAGMPAGLPGGLPDVSAEEERLARELVARRAGKPSWGFKDPRTSLFLPFWDRLLAAPFFLLLYRHPVEVTLSLLRRGIDLEVQADPWTAIDGWTVYNRQILAFQERHPERCLLLSIAGVRRDLQAALALAAARSGLPLGEGAIDRVYAAEELRTGLAAPGLDWPSVLPEAMGLYRRLEGRDEAPGAPRDSAGDPDLASPRERELQEASEHLLAAALAARRGAPAPALAPLGARSEFSELKQVLARRDDHLRELRARIDGLTGRLEELGREHEALERTRVMRLVRSYWGTARRLRRWRRQTAWSLGRLVPVGRPARPPAAGIVVGCVAENDPRFLAQALRLTRSLRWFGGALATARMLVCVVEGIGGADRARLEDAGAEVRIVPPFDRRNRQANKLQLFAEAFEAPATSGLLLLDCDTVVVRDPWPFLAGGALQAKIADVVSVTQDVFRRLFRHFGLPLPRRRYRATLTLEPTILYCNSGVVFVTREVAAEIVPAWRAWNLRLLAARELLGPSAHHANQASLALALADHPVPFAEAPAALNLPLHMTALPRPSAVAATDPVILHYHEEIDERGLLLPAPWPRTQARIEALNRRMVERLDEEGRQAEPTAAPPPAVAR